jgi:hypothetical protein
MRTYWGSGGIVPSFLTSALGGGESLAAAAFLPGTHWIGGWVGPTAGLDAVEKRKIFHCRELNPGLPARRYTEGGRNRTN